MTFLRNAWYAAAWSHEIGHAFFTRRILGEPLLFFRSAEGKIRAIEDLCPHRFVPLSKGRLVDDIIECGYHGLRFDGLGNCVKNPHGEGNIASRCRVKSYCSEVSDGIVWVWMGTPESANPSGIPRYPHLLDPSVKTLDGTTHVNANYQLAVDNILDPSHAIFLHGNFHRTDREHEFLAADFEVTAGADWLTTRRWVPNSTGPEIFMRNFDDPSMLVDHWVEVRWNAPAALLVDVGVTPTGSSVDSGIRTFGIHLLTPETEDSTHYLYAHSRNFRQQDAQADANQREWQRVALGEQDKPMIEAQQRHLRGRELMSLHPVILHPDLAAVRARRIMSSLIEKQELDLPNQHKSEASVAQPGGRASS